MGEVIAVSGEEPYARTVPPGHDAGYGLRNATEGAGLCHQMSVVACKGRFNFFRNGAI